MTDTILMAGMVGLLFLVARLLSSKDEREYASTFKSHDVSHVYRRKNRSIMNNLPGNIQLSQEEDDNLTRQTSAAAIANIEAQLKKMPDNPRMAAKRKALEEQRDNIQDRLTALDAERPTNRDGLSDASRAALADIEAQLTKLPKTRGSEPKAKALMERRQKILDHAEGIARARQDAIDTDRQPRSRTQPAATTAPTTPREPEPAHMTRNEPPVTNRNDGNREPPQR